MPKFSLNCPTIIGKRKVMEALISQFENDAKAIPFALILLGKISAKSTKTVAPIEDAKDATNPINNTSLNTPFC